MGTLKPQINGPSYSNTVIGTLAVDGWAVTLGAGKNGPGKNGPGKNGPGKNGPEKTVR